MRRPIGLLLAGALAGCTVGPNYRAPQTPAPRQYGEDPQPSGEQVALDGWWHRFGDPELDRLVAIALAEAPDIQTAAARIAEARGAERAARGGLFPEVDATAGANYQRFSKNAGFSSLASLFGGGGGSGGGASGGGGSSGSGGGVALPGNSIKTYSTGFDASWELDVFGGARRQLEGARARTEAAVWNARDAQLSLIAELADDYLQLRTAQERERIARAEVDRQSLNLKLMGDQAKTGLVPQGDFIRQRAQLATAQAAVGPIVAEGKGQMHGIAVLLGRTPDSLITELAVERPQLAPPPAVPAGLPSEMLRRRPDVRAAERNLQAATADVGVAVADLYPRFSLTSMATLISTALGNLFSGDSLQITAAANATFPVLDFGRRSGQVEVRRAEADVAYQQYRSTVLGALRDVEDALIRLRTELQRNAALKGGLTDAARATQAVEARYRTGLVDYSAVLEARQSLLANQDQLAQSDGTIRRDMLALFKALGGGWEDLPLPDVKAGVGAAGYTRPRR